MYALTQENGHIVWKEWWYALTSGTSLQANLYMTHEDHVFVVNVMVTNLTWEIVASSVIAPPGVILIILLGNVPIFFTINN
jgi:hypothetical protein